MLVDIWIINNLPAFHLPNGSRSTLVHSHYDRAGFTREEENTFGKRVYGWFILERYARLILKNSGQQLALKSAMISCKCTFVHILPSHGKTVKTYSTDWLPLLCTSLSHVMILRSYIVQYEIKTMFTWTAFPGWTMENKQMVRGSIPERGTMISGHNMRLDRTPNQQLSLCNLKKEPNVCVAVCSDWS